MSMRRCLVGAGGVALVLFMWAAYVNYGHSEESPPPPDFYVDIDIKPGSDPNTVNVNPQGNGVVPVAILSSEGFDATLTVDPATVELLGSDVAVRGKNLNLMSHEEDVNGDGLTDLVVQVYASDMIPGLIQDGKAKLTGSTYDEQDFEGVDEIRLVPE